MSTKTVLASELVEDFDLYPRHDVDSVHVNNLVRALEAGVELPPIIACKKSKRIVDGFHRKRAWQKHKGDEAMVPIIWKTYASEAALFEDAVRLNATHGRKLDRQDEVRITVLAEKLGLSKEKTALALSVTVERVEELSVRVVLAREPEQTIPMKLVAKHLQGKEITKAQEQAMTSFGGNSFLQTVGQVHRAIESGLYDTSDERVIDALDKLATLIMERLPEKVPA